LAALEDLIPKKLCLVCAILISRRVIKIEDIWPHLSNFAETKDDLDEIDVLLKKQIKLVHYQYQHLFETIMNKEAYEQ